MRRRQHARCMGGGGNSQKNNPHMGLVEADRLAKFSFFKKTSFDLPKLTKFHRSRDFPERAGEVPLTKPTFCGFLGGVTIICPDLI